MCVHICVIFLLECGGPTTDINSTAVLPSVVPAGLECVWFFKQVRYAKATKHYIFVVKTLRHCCVNDIQMISRNCDFLKKLFKDKNASMYIFVREFHIQPGDTFTVYNGAKSDGVNVDKIVTLVGSAGLCCQIVVNHCVCLTYVGYGMQIEIVVYLSINVLLITK